MGIADPHQNLTINWLAALHRYRYTCPLSGRSEFLAGFVETNEGEQHILLLRLMVEEYLG